MKAKLMVKTRHQGQWIPAGTEVVIINTCGNRAKVRVPGCVEPLQVFDCFLTPIVYESLATVSLHISERPDFEEEFRYGSRLVDYLHDTRTESTRVRLLNVSRDELQQKLDQYWESTGLRKVA